jgi:hypothetical protein
VRPFHSKGRFIEELGEKQREKNLLEQQRLKNLVREDYKMWISDFKQRYPEWDVRVRNIDASSNDVYSNPRSEYYKTGKVLDVFFDEEGNLFVSNDSLAEIGDFSLPSTEQEQGISGSYGYSFGPGDYPELTSIGKGHWTSNDGVARAFARGDIAQSKNMYSEGDAVYSYGSHFPIAVRLPDGTILWNKESYSNTTARHKAEVSHAIGWRDRIDVESNVLQSLIKASPPGATRIDEVDPQKVATKFKYNYDYLENKYPGVTEKIGKRYEEKAEKDLNRMKYELEMLQSMVQNSLKRKESMAVEQLYPKVYNRYGAPIENLVRLDSSRVVDVNLDRVKE